MNLVYNLFTQNGSLAFLISLILKSLLIILLAMILTSLLRKNSASVRHWIWSLMFGILILLIPLLILIPKKPMYLLPSTKNILPQENSTLTLKHMNQKPSFLETDFISHSTQENKKTVRKNRNFKPELLNERKNNPIQLNQKQLSPGGSKKQDHPNITTLILILWLSGTLLFLARLGWNLTRIWQLARNGQEISNKRLQKIFKEWIKRCQIKQKVRIIENKKITIPATFGLFHPIILLPEGINKWPETKRNIILCHELGHIKRMDFFPNVLAQIAGSFYWFNPLIWIAIRRFWTDREKACDDYVLRIGFPGEKYAEHLMDIARGLPRLMPIKQCASVMAWKSNLKNRFKHILKQKVDRKQLSHRVLFFSVVLALFVILPLAMAKIQNKSIQEEPTVPLYTKTLPELVTYLGHMNPQYKVRAAWALGDREDSRAVPPLIDALKDNNPDVRGMVAWALGEIKDKRALKPLINKLSDKNSYAREMIVKAVGEFEDKIAVEPLTRMLKDKSQAVRLATVWAFGELKGSAAQDAIYSALDDDYSKVREMALGLLGKFKNPHSVPKIIPMLKDSESMVRVKAAIALGKLKAEQGIDFLVEALEDKNVEVRCAATWALGEIGNARALGALLRMLKDNSPEVRYYAVWALDEISPDD